MQPIIISPDNTQHAAELSLSRAQTRKPCKAGADIDTPVRLRHRRWDGVVTNVPDMVKVTHQCQSSLIFGYASPAQRPSSWLKILLQRLSSIYLVFCGHTASIVTAGSCIGLDGSELSLVAVHSIYTGVLHEILSWHHFDLYNISY